MEAIQPQPERRVSDRRLPEFEMELDIDKMSQKEINVFVIDQIVQMRKEIRPFIDMLSTASRVARWTTAAAVFIAVVAGAISSLSLLSKYFNKH